MGVCLLCTVLFVAALGQIAQVQSVSVPAASPASRLSGLVTAASLFPRIPGSFTNRVNNAAVDWNIALQWSLRNRSDTNVAPRVIALQSVSVWKALQANAMQDDPLNETAIVAYASHFFLMSFYPTFYSQYDQLLALQTQGIPKAEMKAARELSTYQVVQQLAARLDDGAQQTGTQAPMTAPPGVFRDVSSSGINGAYRAYSQWAQTLPLCITKNNTDTFKADFNAPYTYPSDSYNTEYTAVHLLGGLNSTLRTDAQTETAHFWSDAGTGVISHWNQLALTSLPANATIWDTQLLLTQLNVAIFDNVVTGYYIKYGINFWRPYSAITVGDADHLPDPTWTSLVATPNNPGSPATQTGIAGAAEIVFQRFYGTDAHPFTLGTEYSVAGQTLSPRSYPTFSAAATEVTESRYIGGTEFKADSAAGRSLGREIASLCLERFADILPAD